MRGGSAVRGQDSHRRGRGRGVERGRGRGRGQGRSITPTDPTSSTDGQNDGPSDASKPKKGINYR